MFENLTKAFRVQPLNSKATAGKVGGVANPKRKDMGGRVPITVGESRYLRADILERAARWR